MSFILSTIGLMCFIMFLNKIFNVKLFVNMSTKDILGLSIITGLSVLIFKLFVLYIY